MATGAGQEAIIVDPGIGKPNLVKSIVEKVQEHNLKPVAVLITHGHLDHMFSVLPLTKEIPMRTYITGSDRFLLSDPMGDWKDRFTNWISRRYAQNLTGKNFDTTRWLKCPTWAWWANYNRH